MKRQLKSPTERLTKRGESILEKVSASLGDNPEVAESVIDVEVTGIHEIRKGTEDNSLEDSSAPPQGTEKEDIDKLSGSTVNSPEKPGVDSLVSGKDDLQDEYDTDTDDDIRTLSQKANDLTPLSKNIFLQRNYWGLCTEATKK